MTDFAQYSCGMCSSGPFPTKDAYADHLEAEHEESWLARWAKKERTKRAKAAALAATHSASGD